MRKKKPNLAPNIYIGGKVYIPIYETGHGTHECDDVLFYDLERAIRWVNKNKKDFINLQLLTVDASKGSIITQDDMMVKDIIE